jgi:hypothetical protein
MPLKISKTEQNRLKRLESRRSVQEDHEAVVGRLMAELDTVAARLRAAPDWREPAEAELTEIERDFDELVKGLGAP